MKHFREENNMLIATFECKSFQEALHFVNQIGNIAEISNHHPHIQIHDYKMVTVETTTHDAANTITQKDYAIAKLIEASYKK